MQEEFNQALQNLFNGLFSTSMCAITIYSIHNRRHLEIFFVSVNKETFGSEYLNYVSLN